MLAPARVARNPSGALSGNAIPQRAYGDTGNKPKGNDLPNMPSRQPKFDGRPAPLLLPALARAVTKSSGPFSCPVCFKAYPLCADVFHHVKKRHGIDVTDAPAVRDANAMFKRGPAAGGSLGSNSGGFFGAPSPPIHRGNSMGSGADILPPGWTRVWSNSKNRFYFYNQMTGKSCWSIGDCR